MRVIVDVVDLGAAPASECNNTVEELFPVANGSSCIIRQLDMLILTELKARLATKLFFRWLRIDV